MKILISGVSIANHFHSTSCIAIQPESETMTYTFEDLNGIPDRIHPAGRESCKRRLLLCRATFLKRSYFPLSHKHWPLISANTLLKWYLLSSI